MELERLHEFVKIADRGSLNEAAEELRLPPATLRSRLHVLENTLGVSLFQKANGALALTGEGKRLYADATEIVAEYAELRQSLRQPDAQTFQSLKIAVSGVALPLFLGPFLDLLNEKYPHIRLELFDDTRFSIAEGLGSGEVDVYFAPAMNRSPRQEEIAGRIVSPPRQEGIVRRIISPPRHCVLLPERHPLASRPTVSMRDLDGECFILYPQTKETGIRDFQLANLQASGIRRSVYDSGTSPVFFTLLVPVGKGIVLLPTPIFNLPPRTVCLPLTDAPCAAFSALFYSQETVRPEVRKFVDLFFQFTKETALYEHRQAL